MIQELLGGGVVEDRKISVAGGLLGPATETSSCSSAHSAAASMSSSSTSNAEQQNLRCPRCDSTNTKFCYYNNYNLTQPRHFCKTCRRYWTQGGALRNVPIGGGCRKTKSTGISLGAGKSNGVSGNKAKPLVASDIVVGKSGLGAGIGGAMAFDHDLPSSPILWTAPYNSHLLSLLRASQTSGISNTNSGSPVPSPNPNPIRSPSTNPVRIKEEGPMVASHLVPEASLLINALNARNLGLDPLGQVPLGLCNSLWRSSGQYQHPLQHQQPQPQQPQQQSNGLLLGENPGSGIQELFQRLRSTGNYYTDCPGLVLGNVGYSSSSSSHLLF